MASRQPSGTHMRRAVPTRIQNGDAAWCRSTGELTVAAGGQVAALTYREPDRGTVQGCSRQLTWPKGWMPFGPVVCSTICLAFCPLRFTVHKVPIPVSRSGSPQSTVHVR
jgi:hypothetical protein